MFLSVGIDRIAKRTWGSFIKRGVLGGGGKEKKDLCFLKGELGRDDDGKKWGREFLTIMIGGGKFLRFPALTRPLFYFAFSEFFYNSAVFHNIS